MSVTSQEKCELLKDTIRQLYSNEGRSFSYIGRLLLIDRQVISQKIKDWDLPEPKPQRHMNPSNVKWLNANRQKVKALLDKDIPLTKIGPQVGKNQKQLLNTFIPYDPVLKKAHADYIARIHENHETYVENHKKNCSLEYWESDLPGECWKDILGYSGYQVSNKGRTRHYIKRYDTWVILKPQPNKNNGRLYINLQKDLPNPEGNKRPKRQRKNLMLARVVAFAFVDGHTDERDTVNHKDGDIANHDASNLEWTTQSENNAHAYRELNRPKVNKKRYKFAKILYQNKYEFKTVAAFARFLGKSETQIRRYIDEPERHDIKLIRNCND